MNEERGDRPQLPDEVAAYVRELIFSGSVKPGEFLRLDRVAAAVGVSNTPVREGLLRLRSEGLVRLVPRRGFAVEHLSPQDVRDQFWVQARLAGELAARAATRITPDEVADLATNLAAYERALNDGNEGLIAEHGVAFHRAVNRVADSQRLSLLLRSVAQQLPNRFYAALERTSVNTHHDHSRLLAAIRFGDAQIARMLMEEHMLDRSVRLIELLEQRGLWVDEAHA